MISNNLIALIITFLVALIWLRINDFAAHRGWISSRLSRKIIHIGTGPLFVLCWLLFKETASARYLAALVPLSFTVQFFLVGTGVWKDEAAVQAMSRTGDRREILRGPLYYGIVFVALTIIFWKESPTGIVALMILCGGDGLADLVGLRLPILRLPWNRVKSLGGSIAVFIGGWIMAAIVLACFSAAGALNRPLLDYLPGLTLIAFGSMLVESLPIKDVDNLTVPLFASLLGYWLF